MFKHNGSFMKALHMITDIMTLITFNDYTNKISHFYNINFLNMMKPTLCIFSVLVWKRFEEEFLDQSS